MFYLELFLLVSRIAGACVNSHFRFVGGLWVLEQHPHTHQQPLWGFVLYCEFRFMLVSVGMTNSLLADGHLFVHSAIQSSIPCPSHHSVEDDAVLQHSNDLTPIAAYMELSSTTTFSPGTSNDLLTEIAGKEPVAMRSASSSMC